MARARALAVRVLELELVGLGLLVRGLAAAERLHVLRALVVGARGRYRLVLALGLDVLQGREHLVHVHELALDGVAVVVHGLGHACVGWAREHA